MKIIGIMAVDPNGVIGVDNNLPWHYPDELKHFHRITNKQILLMGRKTFECIPQNILKDRVFIVFSRNKLTSCSPSVEKNKGCILISSLKKFLSIQKSLNFHRIFMIGGAQIAHLLLEKELVSEFVLTKIHKPYEGNIRFDLTLFNKWTKTFLSKTKDYSIYRLIYAN